MKREFKAVTLHFRIRVTYIVLVVTYNTHQASPERKQWFLRLIRWSKWAWWARKWIAVKDESDSSEFEAPSNTAFSTLIEWMNEAHDFLVNAFDLLSVKAHSLIEWGCFIYQTLIG